MTSYESIPAVLAHTRDVAVKSDNQAPDSAPGDVTRTGVRIDTPVAGNGTLFGKIDLSCIGLTPFKAMNFVWAGLTAAYLVYIFWSYWSC